MAVKRVCVLFNLLFFVSFATVCIHSGEVKIFIKGYLTWLVLAVHAGGHSCVPGRPSAETGRDTALGDHSVGLCRNHSPPVHRTAPLQGRLHNASQLNGAF